jgi:hypothetical protein
VKLYSIRHKISGKWFVSSTGSQVWNATSPHFWKTIDGVRGNLKKIASDKIAREDSRGYWYLVWGDYDPARLQDIEVIVTNVSILGEESFPASEFVDFTSDVEITD